MPGYVPPHLRNKKQSQEAQAQKEKAAQLKGGKMVVVGLDQWVNINKNRFTKLCTSGIVGCVGLVLEGPNFICATHIFDGFEKDWKAYQHQLDLLPVTMGSASRATIVISSNISSIMVRVNLLKDWLAKNNVNSIDTIAGNGFIVRKDSNGAWHIDLKDDGNKNEFLFESNIVASQSGPYVDNWGTLSANAADSGG